MSIDIPCPTCSGTADHSTDDGHRDNKKDACVTCGGTKTIPAATGTLQTAAFNPDYFVEIDCDGRKVTPYKFKERWKAEYEVANYSYIFGLRENPPGLMEYNERTHPNGEAYVHHEKCFACDNEFRRGELVFQDVNDGTIHAACCGPERSSYVGKDGEPLKEGEPLPKGTPYGGYTSDEELRALFSMDGDEELDPSEISTHDGVWKRDARGWWFDRHPDVD